MFRFNRIMAVYRNAEGDDGSAGFIDELLNDATDDELINVDETGGDVDLDDVSNQVNEGEGEGEGEGEPGQDGEQELEQEQEQDEGEGEGEVEPEQEPEPKKEEPKKEEQEEEPQPEIDEEERQQRYQQARAQLEKDFSISDEDANLIMTEPETVLPRLMANMYERIARDVMDSVGQMFQSVPTQIAQYNSQVTQEQQAQARFNELNPGLADIPVDELAGLVTQVAPLVKSMNPNASNDELILAAGRMIGAVKGIDAGAAKQQAPAKKPAKQEKIVREVHKPAGRTTGSVSDKSQPPADENPFITELLDSIDD